MSDLFIKTSTVSEKNNQSTNGQKKISTLAGLAGSFQDLIQKAGARIENGISALTGQSTVFGISESVSTTRSDNDFNHDYSSEKHDYADTRTDRNDHNDDRSDSQRTDRNNTSSRDDRLNDDRDREHNSGSSDSNDDITESHSDEQDISSAPNDNNSENDDSENNNSTATNEQNSNASDNSRNEGQKSDGQSDLNAGKGGATDNIANTGTVDKVMGTVLSEMMAGNQTAGVQEATAAQSQAINEKSGILSIQNIAAASIGTQEVSSKLGIGSDDKNSIGNLSTQLSQNSNQSNAQAKVATNNQLANSSNSGQNTVQSNIANQASELAKAIGDGNKAQVNVSVTNESQNLMSRPNATLFSSTNTGAEAFNQSNSGQQAGSQTQSGTNQNLPNQAQNNQASGVANGLVQSQNTNTTLGSTNRSAAGEGIAQTGSTSSNQQTQQTQALNTSTNGLARAGGGEGINQSGNIATNQQTQQAQAQSSAQRAKNTEKPAATGRSMVEQISVKVTKALEAGIDKINIQLRPAHMGRVEVKLEMSQDNRLSAMVVVDNRETLENLKNDSRALQRSLLEAGLNTDSGDLNFSLRGEENNEQEKNSNFSQPLTGDEEIAELEEMIIEEAIIASDGRVLTNGRIDVRA
ncbi:MAG: flagellar hook-length control protein FliK [Pseudomonadota bacterium]|nr:flagellar hook-length control protein FliK [Pseudomonadota bacterium]